MNKCQEMDNEDVIKKRSRGGYIDVGIEEEGSILGFVKGGDNTYIIKNLSVHQLITANDIDPEKTNISIPNMGNRLLFNFGSNSVTLSKVFLSASMFFTNDNYNDLKKMNSVWGLIIAIANESLLLDELVEKYLKEENLEIENYNEGKKNKSYVQIPSIPNVKSQVKNMIIAGFHIQTLLIELTDVILPELKLGSKCWWSTIEEQVRLKLGENSNFYEFVSKNADFMSKIRELRNGVDHTHLTTVKIKNFTPKADSNIYTPTISLKTKKVTLDEMPISAFLDYLREIFFLVELTYVHLASLSIQSSIFKGIKKIPNGTKKKYEHITYSFFSNMSSDFHHQ